MKKPPKLGAFFICVRIKKDTRRAQQDSNLRPSDS